MEYINYSKNGNAPEDAKFFNHESFQVVWPKVIARVWLYKKENDHRGIPQQIESEVGLSEAQSQDLQKDDQWYAKLLSSDSLLVKEALIEEGLVTLGSNAANVEENDWVQWISSNILVLPYGGERTVKIEGVSGGEQYSKKTSSADNGWSNVNDIEHTIVLTLPYPPEDEGEFAIALADYCCTGKTYVFSCT